MSNIKERPILFSAPMVRAILDGRKTVTRRAVKVQPEVRMVDMIGPMLTFKNKRGGHWLYPNAKQQIIADCPYGTPGERLWVREAFGLQVRHYGGGTGEHIVYRATNPDAIYCKSAEGRDYPVKWKPSIHMPRHSCRILLEITDVRVERLQDISEGQAVDEGLVWEGMKDGQTYWNHTDHRYPPASHQQFSVSGTDAISAFRNLWKSTGGDWEANPWVWVVEFKRVQS